MSTCFFFFLCTSSIPLLVPVVHLLPSLPPWFLLSLSLVLCGVCFCFCFLLFFLLSSFLGDPICDQFMVCVAEECTLFSLADGCGWSARIREAAVEATHAFMERILEDFVCESSLCVCVCVCVCVFRSCSPWIPFVFSLSLAAFFFFCNLRTRSLITTTSRGSCFSWCPLGCCS
jgi:hypothetical protein